MVGFVFEATLAGVAHSLSCMDIESKRAALGNAIRKRREEQSLSQEKLALMIGSSKSHIWRIETGRVGVGIDDLSRIADALDTKVRNLVEF